MNTTPIDRAKISLAMLYQSVQDIKQDIDIQNRALSHQDTHIQTILAKFEHFGMTINEIKATLSTLVQKSQGQELQINTLETKVTDMRHDLDEHLKDHKEHTNQKASKNWQMWFLIITVILTSVAGLIFGLLK